MIFNFNYSSNERIGSDFIINILSVIHKIYIPNFLLEKLSNNKDPRVRVLAALNKKCSYSVLQKLSNDNNWMVRRFLLKSNNLNNDILFKLFEEFPKQVTNHINCPAFLKILSK